MSHLKYGLDDLGSGRKSSHGPGNARAFAQITLALLLAAPIFSVQAELYFNPRFLADDPAAVADLSGFANGQEVPPGTYRVDIYLNDGFMTTRDVTFNSSESDRSLVPCLTRGQLAGMGINTTSIKGIGALASDACVP
ncbi:fimbrial protein, partial [Klebsiella oxytoca]|uniref:FimD/PapC N-terminal domain-containing protein n=2 Tax=Klebsiella/Raoultella group TaxID=2890311 RepID=UPI0023DE8810